MYSLAEPEPWFPECEKCALVRFVDGKCAVYARKPRVCRHFTPHEPVLLSWIECLTCENWTGGIKGSLIECKVHGWVVPQGARYVQKGSVDVVIDYVYVTVPSKDKNKPSKREKVPIKMRKTIVDFEVCPDWTPNERFVQRFPKIAPFIKLMLDTKPKEVI